MVKKSRNWRFTLNNYIDDEHRKLRDLVDTYQIKYIVFGKEVGEETHTPHLQGFISFHNPKTFDQTVKFLGNKRINIEMTKGSEEENRAYCTKDQDFFQWGVCPIRQGKRNDIEAVRDVINNGGGMREVVQVATSYQSIRFAETLIKYAPLKERTEPPLVKWYYGPTGTGKSRQAYSECPINDLWVNSNTLQWYDGFCGQHYVIIDDFRASQILFSFFLRILDRYPLMVPVKGGFARWDPTTIIITSTHHPKDCWKNEDINESLDQLLRRINIIQYFQKTT